MLVGNVSPAANQPEFRAVDQPLEALFVPSSAEQRAFNVVPDLAEEVQQLDRKVSRRRALVPQRHCHAPSCNSSITNPVRSHALSHPANRSKDEAKSTIWSAFRAATHATRQLITRYVSNLPVSAGAAFGASHEHAGTPCLFLAPFFKEWTGAHSLDRRLAMVQAVVQVEEISGVSTDGARRKPYGVFCSYHHQVLVSLSSTATRCLSNRHEN
eukprot:1158586-Pelagomonas_calceolata.AAC.1